MSDSRKERERIAREGEVLAAAEKLFSTKGYENTTMDEIAKESEFTKKTVYQYFICKENLYYAVTLNGVKIMLSYIEEEVDAGKNGFEKLAGARRGLYRYVSQYPENYRLMNYAQYIRSDPSALPYFIELNKHNHRLFEVLSQSLNCGMKDGSIRPEMSSPLTIYAIFFLTTGFMNRFSEAGEHYGRMLQIDPQQIADIAFEMLDRILLP